MRALSAIFIVVGFLICLPVGSVGASTNIVQSKDFSGIPNLTETLNFKQFDDLGGTLTLQSIQVLLELEVSGGSMILDNDGVDPAAGTFEFGAKGSISSSDVSLLDIALDPVTGVVEAMHIGTFNLAGNQGDGQTDFDPTNPDGMQYYGSIEFDSDSGFITPIVFSDYIGTGTFDIEFGVTQWQDFGGISGIEWAIAPVSAVGKVEVIYNYVPEPATMAFLSIGLLFCRRRHLRSR